MRVVAGILIASGTVFMLLAAVGVLRFPDVFARMHAGTKAASLGLALILLAGALLLPGALSKVKLIVALLFQFLTAPVAAHLIGKAAYEAGVPMYERTHHDELGNRAPAQDA